ncbi:hypothetical protein A2U01_0101265, partial [Trifolium medium]|nr:hypothetical protein [Trifolium medium]
GSLIDGLERVMENQEDVDESKEKITALWADALGAAELLP